MSEFAGRPYDRRRAVTAEFEPEPHGAPVMLRQW